MSCQSLSCDGDQLPACQDRSVHFTSDVERKSMDFDFGSDAGSNPGTSWSRAMSRSAPASVPVVSGPHSFGEVGESPSNAARFPRLEECAHFHYGRVTLGGFRVCPIEHDIHSAHQEEGDDEGWVTIIVKPHSDDQTDDVQFSQEDQDKNCSEWMVTRNAENFKMLDSMLHRCIYDRKVSGLPDLSVGIDKNCLDDRSSYYSLIADYLHHFSIIADDTINCGPILNWFQMDNKGHKLLVASEDSNSINTPALAAAYSVRRYVSQARDEISFEVGDMISVIDMPGPSESTWWRGKRGFRVGFFPQECVAVIGDKVPRNMKQPPPIVGSVKVASIKPVLRKHGKLISLFRSFILSRPSRRSLRQQGILKERVFGCDLGEHLLNSGNDVPQVLTWCSSIIEAHGCVDGIYRLSGAASATQRLRLAFDEERPPPNPPSPLDVHSVASLLKMYFRELPNPLCTYQLYSCFVSSVKSKDLGDGTEFKRMDDAEKLMRMRETVVKLPPPHYRTLHFLMRHLHRMSLLSDNTGMTAKNMGIVWAPNLLRSPHHEFSLSGVAIQVVVTEFLICYADLIFSDQQPPNDTSTVHSRNDLDTVDNSHVSTLVKRPKSLPIATPTKLLSLEEARSKQQLRPSIPKEPHYIEVGGGPNSLPRYHTVIQLPSGAAKRGLKRSPSGWRGLFFRANKHRLMPTSSHGHPTISEPTSIPVIRPVEDCSQPIKKDENSASAPVKMTVDTEDARSTRSCESLGSEGDSLPPLLITAEPKSIGSHHNRSASCDSYFEASLAELAGMRLRLTSQEREMDIFSEDDTTRQVWNKNESSSDDTTAEPSPVKSSQLPQDSDSPMKNYNGKKIIEEDLLFIDCQTPEHASNNRSKTSVDYSNSNFLAPTADSSKCDKNSENDANLTPLKVKMRERNSPRRSEKMQLSRHSHSGVPPPSKMDTNPHRHSTLIRVDWHDTTTNNAPAINPSLCGYRQLQNDSDASLQTGESKDSLLKRLIESKESLSSRALEQNPMITSGGTLTWNSSEKLESSLEKPKSSSVESCQSDFKFKKIGNVSKDFPNTIASNDSLLCRLTDTAKLHTHDEECRNKCNSIVEDLSVHEYENVGHVPLVDPKSKMATSSDSEICQFDDLTKSKITITPSDENFSSNMADSLEESLSPSNISYQNLNRLSILSGESGKANLSKESTPTFSPHEQEKTEEIYECFSFSKPSYVHLESSSGGCTPSSPKNKSPLKSTISIIYRSPTKENVTFDPSLSTSNIDFNENLGESRIYENVDGIEDNVVVPNSSDASLPTQVANEQSLIDSIASEAVDDIYNKVKFFRQSIHEINSLIMDSDDGLAKISENETPKENVGVYEMIKYGEPSQAPQHSYENVDLRKMDVAKVSPLSDSKHNSYENVVLRKGEEALLNLHEQQLLMKTNQNESDKENSDENKNIALSMIGDCFAAKRSSVKQLAHKFESPADIKSPFQIDKLSKLSSSEKVYYDRQKSASFYDNRCKMNSAGKTIPCTRTRSHRLTRHSSNTRSLDENAFIKEFVNQPIHKDHISDVEITECEVDLSRRKSLEALKYLSRPKHLPDLNLNVECGKACTAKSELTLNLDKCNSEVKESDSLPYLNRFVSITPTTENKICLVQARLSPKKTNKSKQKWESREDTRESCNDLVRESADDLLQDCSSDDKKDQLSRERIEKYKEERRLFLREKYSSQSFRGSGDIPGMNKMKSEEDNKFKNFGILERRNTADAAQRSKFAGGRIGLSNELIASESQTLLKDSKIQFSHDSDSKNKSLQDVRIVEDKINEQRERSLPHIDASSSSGNRREKRSPSFNIKDMTAIFEQKSANMQQSGQNQRDMA